MKRYQLPFRKGKATIRAIKINKQREVSSSYDLNHIRYLIAISAAIAGPARLSKKVIPSRKGGFATNTKLIAIKQLDSQRLEIAMHPSQFTKR